MSSNDTNQKIELNGQVAIVTGGGRGIGRAMALALAEADAAVAVVARTAHQLAETVARVEQAGGRAIAFPADVTDQRAIERTVAQVEGQLGPVDLLVNNAAIAGPIAPAWEVDVDQWWRCVGDEALKRPAVNTKPVKNGLNDASQPRSAFLTHLAYQPMVSTIG